MIEKTQNIVAIARDDASGDVRPPEFSDDALALRFAERHSADRRYVERWKTWMCWDAVRWHRDDTLYAFDEVRRVCREVASQCNDVRLRKAIASGATVFAVEKLARADRRLAATITQWDESAWLLNTPDGVWDLRTGVLSPPDRGQYLTKLTSVPAGGVCPVWKQFLDQVTDGDPDFQAYLQRIAGYCLTGSVQEHAVFFLYGSGANGKSTFVDTLLKIAGDYGRAAPSEMLTLSRMERHSTDIAGLQGARIVTAPETHRGRAWDEAKLKQITGGDAIAARLMKRDNVVFSPTFKLLIAGNHKPTLSSPDEAMRRRFHLIPFRVTIPTHLRDDKLGLRLKAEWPGILLWAIQGCANWQRLGLAPPAVVRDATAQYFAEEDVTARWLNSHAEPDANARAKLADLYSSFKTWAGAANLPIGSQKEFTDHLERLGVGRARDRTGNFWIGYRLLEKGQ